MIKMNFDIIQFYFIPRYLQFKYLKNYYYCIIEMTEQNMLFLIIEMERFLKFKSHKLPDYL